MNKTLNLELFKPWFIFNFKWNNRLVLKDKRESVLCLDIDYDPELEPLNNIAKCYNYNEKDLYDIIDDISYLDILEEVLSNKDSDFNLLIDCDDTYTMDNNL